MSMGVNATATLGGLQVERRRRENRGAVSGEGWGLGRGYAPSQKIYEFLISKWCDMVHSGCDVEAPCSNRSTSPARGTYSSMQRPNDGTDGQLAKINSLLLNFSVCKQ